MPNLPPEYRLGFTVSPEQNNGFWVEKNGIGYVRFPQGADFDIVYENAILPPTPTIIHAHGLTPPQGLDGVPYISALPLDPGQSIRYAFALRPQNRGTYWLHSHYGFQRSMGLAAPLVVEGNEGYVWAEMLDQAQDEVIMLQDYCLYPAEEDEASERKAQQQSDSKRIKLNNEKNQKYSKYASSASAAPRGSCVPPQSVFEALQKSYDQDPPGNETCPGVEPATDFDANWHAMLMNGRPMEDPVRILLNQSASFLRLRFLNAASTSNFLVSLPFNASIVAVDGQFVQPVPISTTGPLPFSFWLAVGQRVDLLVDLAAIRGSFSEGMQAIYTYSESAPPSASQVAAVALGFSSNQSAWQPPIAGYAAGFMGFQTELTLHAWEPTFATIPSPTKHFQLNLTGDNGFDSINGYGYQLPPTVASYSPNPHPLRVQQGDIVAITLSNMNPDPHPIHLHHVSFQVIALDGQPIARGALRDTLLVPGGCRNATVLFQAVSPGTWPIHCHNEFHQMAGMMTTLEYILG